jgi:uncharacterized membrane protein
MWIHSIFLVFMWFSYGISMVSMDFLMVVTNIMNMHWNKYWNMHQLHKKMFCILKAHQLLLVMTVVGHTILSKSWCAHFKNTMIEYLMCHFVVRLFIQHLARVLATNVKFHFLL